MRIPMENLSQAPVLTLSPSQDPQPQSLSIRDRVSNMLSGSSTRRYSHGSAPTSPAFQRKMAMSMVVETSDHLSGIKSNLTSCQIMSSSLTNFDRTEVDAEYDTINEAIDETDDQGGPTSLPFVGKTSYFQRFSRTRLSHREPPVTKQSEAKNGLHEEGPERQICLDCKEMVLQVVRAQSTARRLQFAKSLFQQQQCLPTNV